MLKGVAKVRHWWKTGPAPSIPPVPYQVACVCGTVAQGFRQAHHQVVTCAACGRKVFVLPASPLPPVDTVPTPGPGSPAVTPGGFKAWRRPLIAAGLTLIVASLLIATVLYRHLHPSGTARKPDILGQHIDAGRTALAHGKFVLAVRELDAAQEMVRQNPDLLPPAERRELTQWHRQAAMLAVLLPEALEEILRHAADLVHQDEQEWQRVFTERYRDKAIVFDAEVQRDEAGEFQLSYAVFVRGRLARLEMTDLRLFRSLPLEQPQRLLFGVRLADIRLEAEGIWTIRFAPDSGVFLTDLGAAAACCSRPEEELKDLVQHQAEWLANGPLAFP